MEGPFYPAEQQTDDDNDLTLFRGSVKARMSHGDPVQARGEILYLSGIVIDTEGRPQKDITVEIWQTDAKGLYKHPNDKNPGERDPYFQYWCKTLTKEDGKFFFKTLVPGEYKPRPAHIHFNVWKNGKLLLTSQIYMNKKIKEAKPDPLLSSINDLLKLDLTPAISGGYEGTFRIII